ncbi:hypothetical protein NDU88_007171 [Pleurodeles waltl]|uniref:Uncharacterized protein n=1 Tax=Pleurodeles waltl TaxID=8319 RepID=A0AAV7TZ33_PLEWA|nr:hypothetical protein NDU88_007171 [Pleurodeles waltl]
MREEDAGVEPDRNQEEEPHQNWQEENKPNTDGRTRRGGRSLRAASRTRKSGRMQRPMRCWRCGTMTSGHSQSKPQSPPQLWKVVASACKTHFGVTRKGREASQYHGAMADLLPLVLFLNTDSKTKVVALRLFVVVSLCILSCFCRGNVISLPRRDCGGGAAVGVGDRLRRRFSLGSVNICAMEDEYVQAALSLLKKAGRVDLVRQEALPALRPARKAAQGVAAAVMACSPPRVCAKPEQVRRQGWGRGRAPPGKQGHVVSTAAGLLKPSMVFPSKGRDGAGGGKAQVCKRKILGASQRLGGLPTSRGARKGIQGRNRANGERGGGMRAVQTG